MAVSDAETASETGAVSGTASAASVFGAEFASNSAELADLPRRHEANLLIYPQGSIKGHEVASRSLPI